jgi:aminoglycoside phosphotransferase (APT) family kinase protein
MTDALHADELPIDVALVRTLLGRELPALTTLPLHPLPSSGSSNALFRLGDELLVRLPRQPGGSASIDKEARWGGEVGAILPVPVPAVVAVGRPAHGYPERWSVVRWLPGEVPPAVGPEEPVDAGRRQLALDLAAVITALAGAEVPAEARADPSLRWYRGLPLGTRDADTRCYLADCRALSDLDLDLDAATRVWDEAMRLPGVEQAGPPHWYHGDLLAENLLVRDGHLAAVLDLGGLGVGDPTVDLVAAWEVLDAPARGVLRRALGIDDATWLRGRAWALSIAVMTFPYYWRTMPQRCASRLAMVRSVLADAAG